MTAKSKSTETAPVPATPAVAPAPAIAGRDVPHILVREEGMTVEVGRHVVAKIVGLAVREVPGVHAVVPHGAGDRLALLADRVTGTENSEVGVQVEIGTIECAATVHIVCDYGVDIPAVAGKIREKAASRIRNMTGLTLRDLELHVEDLYFAAEPRKTGRELR